VAGSLFDRLVELGLSFDGALIFIFDKEKKNISLWIASNQLSAPVKIDLPYDKAIENNTIIKDLWHAIETGEHIIDRSYSGEVKNEYFRYVAKYNESKIPEPVRHLQIEKESWTVHFVAEKNSMMGFDSWSGHPTKEEDFKILIRFAKVFEQAYTRFLDLQKAEAQAREAQIELGLERVRSKTMAMHNSHDVGDTVASMFDELVKFEVKTNRCGILIFSKSMMAEVWTARSNPDGKASLIIGQLDLEMHPLLQGIYHAWEAKEPVFTYPMIGEDLISYYQAINDTKYYPTLFDLDALPLREFHTDFYFAEGSIFSFTKEPLAQKASVIFKRFAGVFGQTYKRYLDLQKAEAQAREAQIELGLERVRARAMAMQKSNELSELVDTVFKELTKLDFALTWCIINIIDENSLSNTVWAANPDINKVPESYYMLFEDYPFHNAMMKGWKERKTKSVYTLEGEEKRIYDDYLFSETEFKRTPQAAQAASRAMEKYVVSFSFSNFGGLQTVGDVPLSDANLDILSRFGKVFDLTYTRFNDLQKAEAQAREAKIETVLERVRSRTMAMQKSDELTNVAGLLFEQVGALGIKTWTAGFNVWSEDNNSYVDYITSPNGGFIEPYTVHTDRAEALKDISNARKSGVEFDVQYVEGEKIKQLYRSLTGLGEKQFEIMLQDGVRFPAHQYEHFVFGSKVSLMFITYEPVPEAHDIFKRLGKVFEQTYTRFLDLQKAEAQAREAKIETALEKARSRTMGMQSSDELPEVANVLFLEVQALGIPAWSCGYNILAEDKKSAKCWMSSEGTLQTPFNLRLFGEASFAEWGDFLHSEKTMLVQELGDKALDEHYAYMKSFPDLKSTFDQIDKLGLSLPTYQINHLCKFTQGFLLFITYEKVPGAHEIFKRFTKVFEQTYTRFLDLQKAEAQTRQAKIETALEKVRARALAMQLPEELIEVAEVLRYEMGLLGVEELETCSIYIHDEKINRTECWYALKDIRTEEKKLVSDHFPLNLQETWVGKEMEKFYGTNAKQVSILMHGAHRKEWINYCEEKSIPFRGYYGAVIPDRTYHLYKFSHGAIGAASAGDISAESWDLLQRAASVFSLAYSRFKDLTQARFDLQRLKEEKQRAELALTVLQTTQKQLIQSEKMASLGELTAGIAHEIQNPLNFVNNFSEVNKEMLEELKAERLKPVAERDEQTEFEIIEDVIANSEKINHHGKRADAIVKGMLQHSRTSTSLKEPTDINKLADEYLRLSYHGLRAKDKTFNATMKTAFDESIGNINIIPQDIGRVILNLITNAFYAVNEKTLSAVATPTAVQYEPTVSISTKKINDKVEIKVADNGNGIPQKVLDKIFQPFFTTKPTGQGTGLGLSLAYDIVKAHGGELKVETKEGKGSEFIIILPVNI